MKNSAGEDVLIVGGINAAKTVGIANITLTYDEASSSWNKEVSGEIIEVKDYAADEEFMAKFNYVVDELKAYVDQPVGKFMETISTRESMFGDSSFVDLIHRIQLELTEADVSFAAPLSLMPLSRKAKSLCAICSNSTSMKTCCIR